MTGMDRIGDHVGATVEDDDGTADRGDVETHPTLPVRDAVIGVALEPVREHRRHAGHGLITEFYGTVVQNLTPWTPKAPQITRSAPSPEPDSGPGRIEMKRSPTIEDRDQDTHGPVGATADDKESSSEPSLTVNDPWLRVTRG